MSAAAPFRLHLRDFRNFAALDWPAPAARLLLVGPNGAGKTSLIEAIYLAATGRSFRSARLEGCLRRGGGAELAVELEVGARPRRELAVRWSAAAGKTRTLDGKPSALGEHLAVLPLLAWTECEAELVAGPPAALRRFFDRGLVHLRPAALESLGRHQRALAEKRALLARRAGGRELDAWNELVARHGAELARGRAELIDAVDRELGEVAVETGLGAEVALAYRPSVPAALDGEAALAAELARRRPAELARGRPLVGPHLDRIEVLWQGVDARAASAGERKALGLLLLVALARRLDAAGRTPALLLDDADTELDRGRLARVIDAFAGFERLVVSSNRPEVWPVAAGLETVAVERL